MLVVVLVASSCGGDEAADSPSSISGAEVSDAGLLEIRSEFAGPQSASPNADVTSIHYRSLDQPDAGYSVTTAIDIDGNVYRFQRVGVDQESGNETVEQNIGGILERNDYAELVVLVNGAALKIERDAAGVCPMVGLTTLEVNWKDGNGIAGPLPAVAGDCSGYGLRGNVEDIASFLLKLAERIS